MMIKTLKLNFILILLFFCQQSYSKDDLKTFVKLYDNLRLQISKMEYRHKFSEELLNTFSSKDKYVINHYNNYYGRKSHCRACPISDSIFNAIQKYCEYSNYSLKEITDSTATILFTVTSPDYRRKVKYRNDIFKLTLDSLSRLLTNCESDYIENREIYFVKENDTWKVRMLPHNIMYWDSTAFLAKNQNYVDTIISIEGSIHNNRLDYNPQENLIVFSRGGNSIFSHNTKSKKTELISEFNFKNCIISYPKVIDDNTFSFFNIRPNDNPSASTSFLDGFYIYNRKAEEFLVKEDSLNIFLQHYNHYSERQSDTISLYTKELKWNQYFFLIKNGNYNKRELNEYKPADLNKIPVNKKLNRYWFKEFNLPLGRFGSRSLNSVGNVYYYTFKFGPDNKDLIYPTKANTIGSSGCDVLYSDDKIVILSTIGMIHVVYLKQKSMEKM